MAIHCVTPDKISSDVVAVFDVTDIEGKALISSFAQTINDLKSHWTGTDASANLKDLIRVYDGLVLLMKELQNLIVFTNNSEALELQKNIVRSGGTCTVGSEIASSLTDNYTIAEPATTSESWSDPAIVTDAEKFNSFPQSFQKFVDLLNDAKTTMFNNWKDGGDIVAVTKKFKDFNDLVPDYKATLEQVRDNINIVADGKKKLM